MCVLAETSNWERLYSECDIVPLAPMLSESCISHYAGHSLHYRAGRCWVLVALHRSEEAACVMDGCV